MKVLLVDNDHRSGSSLTQALMEENYVVNLVTDGETALNIARACPYDLILLNLLAQNTTSRKLCSLLRGGGYQGSIMMLSESDPCEITQNCEQNIDAGADDCLNHPFELQELLKRLKLLLG